MWLYRSFGGRFYKILKSKARGEQTRVTTKEQKSMVATSASCLGESGLERIKVNHGQDKGDALLIF